MMHSLASAFRQGDDNHHRHSLLFILFKLTFSVLAEQAFILTFRIITPERGSICFKFYLRSWRLIEFF